MSKWKRRPDGKTVKRNSHRIEGQFAPRLIDMLGSPPYRVLNLAEHRVLARLEIELASHDGFRRYHWNHSWRDRCTLSKLFPGPRGPSFRAPRGRSIVPIWNVDRPVDRSRPND